jgi:farnesyl diphosphate synthase
MTSSSANDELNATFLKVFDQIKDELVADFTNLPGIGDAVQKQLTDYYSECFPYTCVGGKLTRGLTVVKGVQVLKGRELTEQELTDACILGWQVEFLQAFFLVADDIMDKSITRRGQPCWYKQPHVTQDNGINDALVLENCIYRTLKRHFAKHESYMDIVHIVMEVTFFTEVGQHIDTNGTPYANGGRAELDLTRFTMERYQACVRYKTSYYSFYLSCALSLYYCGYSPDNDKELFETAEKVCLRLGEYFQIQDDVLDAFAPPEILGKIGTDIEDAKCSWLVCQALERVTDEQKQVLLDSYGSQDEEGVQKIKDLYKELELEDVYHKYEEEQKKACDELIAKIQPEEFQALFNFLLGKIYKRQK